MSWTKHHVKFHKTRRYLDVKVTPDMSKTSHIRFTREEMKQIKELLQSEKTLTKKRVRANTKTKLRRKK